MDVERQCNWRIPRFRSSLRLNRAANLAAYPRRYPIAVGHMLHNCDLSLSFRAKREIASPGMSSQTTISGFPSARKYLCIEPIVLRLRGVVFHPGRSTPRDCIKLKQHLPHYRHQRHFERLPLSPQPLVEGPRHSPQPLFQPILLLHSLLHQLLPPPYHLTQSLLPLAQPVYTFRLEHLTVTRQHLRV